jgi:hypothetical protein
MVQKPTAKPNIAAAIAKLMCLRMAASCCPPSHACRLNRLAANSCDGRHIFAVSGIILNSYRLAVRTRGVA